MFVNEQKLSAFDTVRNRYTKTTIHFQIIVLWHSCRFAKATTFLKMSLKSASILVIDDDVDVLTAVRLLLRPEVKEIVTEKNPENIRTHLGKHDFDVILLDMNFNASINTGNEGIYWLQKIRELKNNACVIMITAYGDIDLAIRSLKEGAYDFVVKPWHN